MENIDKSSIETIMQTLVRQYGKELYLPENEIRFKGLLFDVASDFAKELKTLKVAIAERVPAKLLAVDGKDVEEKVRAMQLCRDTLVDDTGLMEDRVMQVLNILADGLGWDTTFYISEDEDEEETNEAEDEDDDDDAKYETLVYDTIGRFPRYASSVFTDRHLKYTSDSVVIENSSSHIEAKKFSECLRGLFEGCYRYEESLDQYSKRRIDSSLSKEKLLKGEILLVIVGSIGSSRDGSYYYDNRNCCYTIVIHDIEDNFIDYELIDGFSFDSGAYFNRKVLQNRLQLINYKYIAGFETDNIYGCKGITESRRLMHEENRIEKNNGQKKLKNKEWGKTKTALFLIAVTIGGILLVTVPFVLIELFL